MVTHYRQAMSADYYSVSQFVVERRPAVAGLADGRRPRGVLGVLGVRRTVVTFAFRVIILAFVTFLLHLSLPTSVFPVVNIPKVIISVTIGYR